jgi:hypothetical protein
LIYGKPLNFEPRIGFAYRVGDGVKPFVLRGGWGIYDAQTALRTERFFKTVFDIFLSI